MSDQNQVLVVDVPVTLSVTVRGATAAQAKQIARQFADALDPSGEFIEGYTSGANLPQGATIANASLTSPSDESCEILEELEGNEADEDEEK